LILRAAEQLFLPRSDAYPPLFDARVKQITHVEDVVEVLLSRVAAWSRAVWRVGIGSAVPARNRDIS
jgi:hypothetical protein